MGSQRGSSPGSCGAERAAEDERSAGGLAGLFLGSRPQTPQSRSGRSSRSGAEEAEAAQAERKKAAGREPGGS